VYYDRWKNELMHSVRIALLPVELIDLDFQEEPHDLGLNRIITEGEIIQFDNEN